MEKSLTLLDFEASPTRPSKKESRNDGGYIEDN